jgi:AraC-like DNA-binding protein
MVNVWSGSPVVAKVPTVMADYAAGFECTTLRVSGACDETPLAWENYLTRVGKWIAGWRKPLGVFVPQDIYCRFLAEHSHEKISVGDVALHACAAVRSLERHFRAVLGRTVKDEITRLRMERAKRLLVEVDEPIKFIARSCGFSGATYFHEAFIKSGGVTPVAYRRLHVGR